MLVLKDMRPPRKGILGQGKSPGGGGRGRGSPTGPSAGRVRTGGRAPARHDAGLGHSQESARDVFRHGHVKGLSLQTKCEGRGADLADYRRVAPSSTQSLRVLALSRYRNVRQCSRPAYPWVEKRAQRPARNFRRVIIGSPRQIDGGKSTSTPWAHGCGI